MMTPKVVKFTQNKGFLGLYSCRHPDDVQGDYLLPGDQSGEYVPVAEVAPLLELEKIIRAGVALVEQLNGGELDLIERVEAEKAIRAGYPEILRVLREIEDCRKEKK